MTNVCQLYVNDWSQAIKLSILYIAIKFLKILSNTFCKRLCIVENRLIPVFFGFKWKIVINDMWNCQKRFDSYEIDVGLSKVLQEDANKLLVGHSYSASLAN